MKFSHPTAQRYECSGCPARCCRQPWSSRVEPERIPRLLAEPLVRERVGAEGLSVLSGGILPMREKNGILECVFLDEDERCSLHKQFGHDFLPRGCQAFPFGFVRDEKDALVVQLSLLCPSIRDNYGKPLGKQLKAKLDQAGGPGRMSQRMATRDGRMLTRPQFLRVAEHWDSALAKEAPLLQTLAQLFDWTTAFEQALSSEPELVSDAAVDAAFNAADAAPVEPLAPLEKSSYHARLLFSALLGNLCYPSRLRQPARLGKAPWWRFEALRALGNKRAFLQERGTVDLLFAPKPLALQKVKGIPRFLGGEEAKRVRDYLRLTLSRRQIFSEPRHLVGVLLDLALAAVLVSRYARCRAASAERGAVAHEDLNEAIGVAELTLLNHTAPSEQPKPVKDLRQLLLTERASLRGLLASEA